MALGPNTSTFPFCEVEMDRDDKLFGFTLRSLKNGHYVSGAEKLGGYDEIAKISHEMIEVAVAVGRGDIDEINLKVEALHHFNVMTGRLPDFMTVNVRNFREGRKAARRILNDAGVSNPAIENGFSLLTKTFGQGGVCLSGAMVVDSLSGQRLDCSKSGLWIGRVGLTDKVKAELVKKFHLEKKHLQEWLVLSAKVLAMPCLVADLLISSDIKNRDGMVSTPDLGVMYLPEMRSNENEVGGRVLFVRSNAFNSEEMVQYLESSVLLVDSLGIIR